MSKKTNEDHLLPEGEKKDKLSESSEEIVLKKNTLRSKMDSLAYKF